MLSKALQGGWLWHGQMGVLYLAGTTPQQGLLARKKSHAAAGTRHTEHPECMVVREKCHVATAAESVSIPIPPSRERITVPKQPDQIPGPKPYPFIGTMYKYFTKGGYSFKDPYETGLRMYKEHGPIVREQILPGVNVLHLFDPDDIAHVFRNDGKYPLRPPVESIKRYREKKNLCGGIATVNGEEWQKYRSLVQRKMMHPKDVAIYLGPLDEVAEDFISRMRFLRNSDGEIDNYMLELCQFACESVGILCFEHRIGLLSTPNPEPTAEQYLKAIHDYLEGAFKTACMEPIFQKLNIHIETKAEKEMHKSMDIIWQMTMKHVQKAVDSMAVSETPSSSMLYHLLTNPGLSRDEVLVMIADLFATAVDTIGFSMGFLLYNLAKHPEKQEKLRQEVLSVASSGSAAPSDVMNCMPYMRACAKESQRITPTIGIGPHRLLSKDLILSDYRVPAGWVAFFHNDVISRMPEYFPDPDSFEPERWLRENGQTINPFASLPFGYGPRMCLGRRFSDQVMYLASAKLLQNFRIEYNHEDIGSVFHILNRPDKPLRLTFVDI